MRNGQSIRAPILQGNGKLAEIFNKWMPKAACESSPRVVVLRKWMETTFRSKLGVSMRTQDAAWLPLARFRPPLEVT